MAKSRKRIKNGKLNVQKAAHVKAAAIERAQQESTAGDNDNYEPPAKNQRQSTQSNQSRLMFMMMSSLGSIMSNHVVCKECKTGTLDVTALSNSAFNTNIGLTCNFCRVQRHEWSGENNMNDAVFMASKFSGIKPGQLETWSKCVNMGSTNSKGQHSTVTTKSKKAKKINERLNILLDDMKTKDEQQFFQSLLESNSEDDVKLAVDGMYPVRNNSGICVSTVMAKINGKCRIIGKIYRKPPFFKKHPFQKYGIYVLPIF